MKKRFFIVTLGLILVFALSNASIGLASETNDETIVALQNSSDGIITPMDTEPPRSVINLVDYGTYYFSGNTTGPIYTQKAFTGANSFRVVVNNKYNSKLTVTLYKEVLIGQISVGSWTVDANSTLWFFPSNLNSKDTYYLLFSGPNNFDGYIEAVQYIR